MSRGKIRSLGEGETRQASISAEEGVGGTISRWVGSEMKGQANGSDRVHFCSSLWRASDSRSKFIQSHVFLGKGPALLRSKLGVDLLLSIEGLEECPLFEAVRVREKQTRSVRIQRA